MRNRRSICILVSGGLDSGVLAAEMAGRYAGVLPVYVRQGLRWEKAELYWLRRFLASLRRLRRGGGIIKPLRILSLPMGDIYRAHWSVGKKPAPGARTRDEAVYLPGRNLALTVKAAVLCAMKGIPEIALGSLEQNPFPDATPAFFRAWGNVLGRGLAKPIRIRTPFRSQSKVEVIQKGRLWPLGLSFSCIAPKGRRHCGRCNKCAERRGAFRKAGVTDRTIYAFP